MKCLYPECPALPAEGTNRCVVHAIRIVRWDGCYDESWRDLIVDEAFAHPAKMSRALVKRIFTALFESNDLSKGGTVVDPFGGIGTTAIEGASRGCFVVCCELEEKFVNLARRNFDLHRLRWEGMGHPEPFIVKGDSRKLREVLSGAGLRDAVVSSPPYVSGGHHHDVFGAWNKNGRGQGVESKDDAGYGVAAGQMGTMPEGDIDAVIASPPYEGSLQHASTSAGPNAGGKSQAGVSQPYQFYGDADGQLGLMEAGTVEAVISSPPYEEIATGAGGLNTRPSVAGGQQTGRSASSPSQATDQRYGASEGQLARLSKGDGVDAIISSPPYASQDLGGSDGQRKFSGSKSPEENKATKGGKGLHGTYGGEDGQLAALPEGDVSDVVTERPYVDCPKCHGSKGHEITRELTGLKEFDSCTTCRGRGFLVPGVDTIIGSPPFLEGRSETTAAVKGSTPTEHNPSALRTETPGQMANLKAGSVDVVVSSPPFGSGDSASAQSMVNRTDKSAQWVKANAGSAATEGYGDTEGQLGVMPVGNVDAVVASPPFGQEATGHVSADKFKSPEAFLEAGRGNGASDEARLRQVERDKDKTYGDSEGQMAAMPMGDAIVSSPPYEGSLHAADHGIDWSKGQRANRDAGGENFRPGESVEAAYPRSEHNIGNKSGETFWTAARDIVRECHAILKPGGVAVWVVKAFVRDKKIVDFPGDWRKLCEHLGFVTEMEVHASLVAEEVKTDLWGVETVVKRERKSFFRRLAEKKGSPKIDYEVVLFMRKLEEPTLEGPLFQGPP